MLLGWKKKNVWKNSPSFFSGRQLNSFREKITFFFWSAQSLFHLVCVPRFLKMSLEPEKRIFSPKERERERETVALNRNTCRYIGGRTCHESKGLYNSKGDPNPRKTDTAVALKEMQVVLHSLYPPILSTLFHCGGSTDGGLGIERGSIQFHRAARIKRSIPPRVKQNSLCTPAKIESKQNPLN